MKHVPFRVSIKDRSRAYFFRRIRRHTPAPAPTTPRRIIDDGSGTAVIKIELVPSVGVTAPVVNTTLAGFKPK